MNKNTPRRYWLIVLIVLTIYQLVACSKGAISERELMRFVNLPENGLHKEIELEKKIKIAVTYKPSDHISTPSGPS